MVRKNRDLAVELWFKTSAGGPLSNSGMAEFDRSMTEFNESRKRFDSGTPWWPPAGGFSLDGPKFAP